MSDRMRNIFTIFTVALAMFMTNLDTSIVNIALPTFTKIFHTDSSEVSRIVLTYLLAMVSLLLVFGRLSDMFGVERIFTLGYVVFTLASALCAASTSLEMLMAFRFVQGIGGAMLLSTGGAVLIRYLPSDIRGRAFGFITVFGGVGMAIGAPIGGLLISSLSWQWIFLINLPVGVIAFVLIRFILNRKPEYDKASSRFDYAGAALSFIGMFSLLLLLNHGQDFGWFSWQSILLFVLSLGCLGLFVMSEKRCPSPLVQIRILRDRHLAWGFVSTVSVTMVLIGFNFLFPFFFDFVRHLDPGKTGLLLMTFPIVTILVSPISGYLCDRGSPRTVSIVSMMLALAAVALFTVFGTGTSYYFIIMSFLIFGIGLALFYTANTALIMSHATQDKAGMFASLLSTMSYIGAALGINLFEMVFSYGFPTSSTATMDALSEDLLLRSYMNASVFGVIITVFGLIAVIISKEKSSSTQNN